MIEEVGTTTEKWWDNTWKSELIHIAAYDTIYRGDKERNRSSIGFCMYILYKGLLGSRGPYSFRGPALTSRTGPYFNLLRSFEWILGKVRDIGGRSQKSWCILVPGEVDS